MLVIVIAYFNAIFLNYVYLYHLDRNCNEIISPSALLNPCLFVECGGVGVVLHNILDCAMPRINEALMGAILYLLNSPEWRPYCGQLHMILAPFSDFHYKHTSYDPEYYTKRYGWDLQYKYTLFPINILILWKGHDSRTCVMLYLTIMHCCIFSLLSISNILVHFYLQWRTGTANPSRKIGCAGVFEKLARSCVPVSAPLCCITGHGSSSLSKPWGHQGKSQIFFYVLSEL